MWLIDLVGLIDRFGHLISRIMFDSYRFFNHLLIYFRITQHYTSFVQ
jgi:hypothetical protein